MNEIILVPKDELYHYGVKGMRWGHRKKTDATTRLMRTNQALGAARAVDSLAKGNIAGAAYYARRSSVYGKAANERTAANKDYSDKQRKQDRAFYGNRAEKRINKKLNEGHGLRGARHYEVERKERKEKTKKAIKKGVKRTTRVLTSIGSMYCYDQVFNNGAGTRAVKSTVKSAGRVAVTAYMKARGGYDIRWYDK